MAEVKIHTERVDDVPLLVHQQCRMGIPQVLDGVIQAHGNRQGLSVGWLTAFWLSYMLSEADHRMSVVEEWAVIWKKRSPRWSHSRWGGEISPMIDWLMCCDT